MSERNPTNEIHAFPHDARRGFNCLGESNVEHTKDNGY